MVDQSENLSESLLVISIMTPASTLLELIESLPPEERLHVDEYIHFLYQESHSDLVGAEKFDVKYAEYIRKGIREGEEAYERGDVLDVEEGKKYLDELLEQ